MRRGIIILLVLIVGLPLGAFLTGVAAFWLFGSSARNKVDIGLFEGGKIGVVTVEGRIVESKQAIEELERFRKDSGIASIILRVDSPGGSAAASQEILEEVKKVAEKKPVVASFGSVAASGGYYVACGATKVIANPSTITGSIGVRMEHVVLEDLLKWMKVRHETLKSGRYKDIAPIDRDLTAEERKILDGVLSDIHNEFKRQVADARRGLLKEDIDKIADGRIYTGNEALALGLVDALGGFAEAVKVAGELGKIEGEPKLAYPSKKSRFLEEIFGGNEGRAAVELFRSLLSRGFEHALELK